MTDISRVRVGWNLPKSKKIKRFTPMWYILCRDGTLLYRNKEKPGLPYIRETFNLINGNTCLILGNCSEEYTLDINKTNN